LLEAVRPIAAVAVRRMNGAAPVPSAPRAVHVRCLGSFALVADGRALGSIAFPRRKALDLLRHLLLARGAVFPRDVLIERLWPEVDPRTGANRLHVTLHALRGVLDEAMPGVGADLIQCRHGDYRLDPDALGTVDAFAFVDAVDDARSRMRAGDLGGALMHLEQALPLYRGELFADAEDIAFETPRQRYRELRCEALRLLVDLYLRDGRADAAFAALAEARACATDGDFDWHDAMLRQVLERCPVRADAAAQSHA